VGFVRAAGKTTLLQNILERMMQLPGVPIHTPGAADALHAGTRVALLINDMSEVNVDAAIVRSSGSNRAGGVTITRIEDSMVRSKPGVSRIAVMLVGTC
jgi:hypothetical protein